MKIIEPFASYSRSDNEYRDKKSQKVVDLQEFKPVKEERDKQKRLVQIYLEPPKGGLA